MTDALSVVFGVVVLCLAVGQRRVPPLMRLTGVIIGAFAFIAGLAGWAGSLA